MTLPNGTIYACSIPRPNQPRKESEAESALEISDEPPRHAFFGRKLKRSVSEALDNAMAKMCKTTTTGWWSYEICYGRHVRQYHINEDGSIGNENTLGKGPLHALKDGADFDWYYAEGHDGPFLSTRYYNGTVCDLTGDPRVVDIRLLCAEARSRISSLPFVEIKEVDTCRYHVSWWSDAACNTLLRPRRNVVADVVCRRMN
jgi:hypothetical protein